MDIREAKGGGGGRRAINHRTPPSEKNLRAAAGGRISLGNYLRHLSFSKEFSNLTSSTQPKLIYIRKGKPWCRGGGNTETNNVLSLGSEARTGRE